MESVQQRKRPAEGAASEDEGGDLEGLLPDEGRKGHATSASPSAGPQRPRWALAVGLWLALALLWVRWPVYYRALFPRLQAALGDKREVEPAVVTAAISLPVLASGIAFYASRDRRTSPSTPTTTAASPLRPVRAPSVARSPLRRLYALRRSVLPTADPVDLAAVAGFLLVQINLVVGKLLIDREAGKLAASGLADRLARALGLNALYALLLSLLLLARGSFVHALLGLSAERATRFHVWSGQFGGALLLLHGLGYALVWLRDGTLAEKLVPCLDPQACSDKQRYGTSRNFAGLLALLTWLVLALGAREHVRRRRFRLFAALHSLAGPMLVLAGLHYYPLVFWLAPALLLYAVYRVASLLSRGRAAVRSAASLSDKLLRLELELGSRPARFVPGQFVYVQVPAIGEREWHPFSISAGPYRPKDDADADADAGRSLWIDVRVQRGFTQRLLRLARQGELASVRLDGFYGSPVPVSPHMVFVAGGSGMTPFLSVLQRLLRAAELGDGPTPRSVWVVWTSRGPELPDAHCELLDAVRSAHAWRGRVWLHVTGDGGADEDEGTEPDDGDSDALTPRVQRLRTGRSADRSAERVFSGRFGELVGLHLFSGAVLGAAVSMAAVYATTSVWYVKRPLLMAAAALGAAIGAALGAALYLRTRPGAAAYRSVNRPGDAADASTALEMDVTPVAGPSTPRAFAGAASPGGPASALARTFKVERGRPELRTLLAAAHSEIQETFGMSARASVWVCGPPDMQRVAVAAARTLRSPSFQVHEKAFEL